MPKKKEVEDTVNKNEIKKELMAYVDTALEERLEKAIDSKVKKEVIGEVEKNYKRIIREKNHKIFWKNIWLLIFIIIICALVYLIYNTHYYDSYVHKIFPVKDKEEVVEKKDNNKDVEKDNDTDKILDVVEEPNLDDLKEKYAPYIDSYILSEKSIYIDSFYNGELTTEVKNYISLNSMNFDKLQVEEDYNLIDGTLLNKVCLELFNNCKKESFDYNGNNARYFNKLDSYVTNSILERETSLIQRDILDIKEEKDTVTITTIEGVVAGDQLYKVSPNEYVGEYYGEGFMNYQDSLNKMIYTFKNKKLVSIEKG